MKRNKFFKKRIIHIYIIIFVIAIILLTSLICIFKYNIEGETNMPFNLKKMSIISTAQSDTTQNTEGVWHANIIQKNDFFFTFEKNEKHKKEDIITKIRFENFNITKTNEKGNIEIYRPSNTNNGYTYSEQYLVKESLEYVGGLSTNTEILEINNQGGLIGFSIITKNLGEYIFNKNEILPSDGTMLNKANIVEEDISFKVSFDLIIETDSEHQFKSNITVDLPVENILETGIGKLEDNSLKNVVFKRLK